MRALEFFEILSAGTSALLDEIVACLDARDLESLRCCTKSFSNIFFQYMLKGDDQLVISTHEPDLRVFETVIRNPILRNRVRKLVWDVSKFDPELFKYQWHLAE